MDQKQPGLRYAWPWETAIGDERKVLEESRKLASEYVCSTGIAEVLRCRRAVQTLDVIGLMASLVAAHLLERSGRAQTVAVAGSSRQGKR